MDLTPITTAMNDLLAAAASMLALGIAVWGAMKVTRLFFGNELPTIEYSAHATHKATSPSVETRAIPPISASHEWDNKVAALNARTDLEDWQKDYIYADMLRRGEEPTNHAAPATAKVWVNPNYNPNFEFDADDIDSMDKKAARGKL